MGTSREEIERQRIEAFTLVENDNILQFAINTNHGEIPIQYKQTPIPELIKRFQLEKKQQQLQLQQQQKQDNDNIEQEEKKISEGGQEEKLVITDCNIVNDDNNNIDNDININDEQQLIQEFQQQTSFFPCWSSRGYADVTKLQNLVREGYNLQYTMKSTTSTTSSTIQSNSTSTTKSSSSTLTTTIKQKSSIKNRIPYTINDIQSITNYWDPANASIHNVSICRPSHDAWGIGKIILLFCDDYLQSIYTLPWLSLFYDSIQSILKVLNIPLSRVVRMLLASLPPGGTIPIHTDSGEWVQYTHRIHCPILVSDSTKIIFQCGLSLQTVDTIHCTPGHVFEINNQAYHFVCNASNDHRVHLILDYIDDTVLSTASTTTSIPKSVYIPRRQPIPLNAGEIVVQTRRSIDRLIDAGSRCTPTYFIVGAQKAGTTTLYEALVQHPLIINAKRRETHCFDWRWNNTTNTTIDEHRQYIINTFYFANDLYYHPACLTGDSTPSYLIDSKRVVQRLRSVCYNWINQLRFFIMIREPIQRLQSHYAMVTSTVGTPEQLKTRGYEWRDTSTTSITTIINDDIQKMKNCGLLPYWNNTDTATPGKEFDQTVFDTFSGSVDEDKAWDLYLSKHVPLNTGSYGLVSRGLYELNMRPWIRAFHSTSSTITTVPTTTPPPQPTLDNDNDTSSTSTSHLQLQLQLQEQQQQQQQQQFCIIRLEDMKNDGIQSTMNELVWEHLNIPPTTINDTTAKNVRDSNSLLLLDDTTKQYLQRFYHPHNVRLIQFIQSNLVSIKCNDKHLQQWTDDGTCWMY